MTKLPSLEQLPLLKENEMKLYMNISIKRRYFKIRMHLQKLFEAIALSCTVLVSLAKVCWNLTNVRLTHPISFGMTYDVVILGKNTLITLQNALKLQDVTQFSVISR